MAVRSSLSAAKYEAARAAHCRSLATETEEVEDAITAKRLKVAEQLIHIKTVRSHGMQRDGWTCLSGLADLVPLLTEAQSDRSHGKVDVQPVLVRAAAGTGKSWAAQQLANALSRQLLVHSMGVRHVPLLIHVQRLARIVRRGGGSTDWLRLSVEHEYAGEANRSRRAMLLMAYELRSLIIIIGE